MDTPTPLTSVSTSVSPKGELGNLSQGSAQEPGVMRTILGEVTLSQSIEERGNEVLISLLGIANICTAQEANPSLVFQHNLVFLPPETVELEIQISELLQALEEAPSSDISQQKSFSSKNHLGPPAKVSIFSLQASSSTQTQYKPATQEPSTFQPLTRPLVIQEQPSLFQTSERCAIKTVPSYIHRKAIPTSVQHTSSDSSRSRQANLSTGIPIPTQKEWELSSHTTKSCSTQKEKQQEGQQEKSSHQEHSNKDANQEDHESESDNLKALSKRKLKSEKISRIEDEEVFSISYLAYNLTSRSASSLDQESCQSAFQRKPLSPMSLFSSQNSTENIPENSQVENVFLRFMRLMARILGQAEAEAHELYLRVKERTDNVDTLTLLLSKINNEKGAIDWNQNAEMQALVDQAKRLGVTIHDSYSWSEDEKKLLKENIQMRKENMEKITQLERTDMQRHLQEVSQCHQARSNVLKLLKELMDTFIYNMRP